MKRTEPTWRRPLKFVLSLGVVLLGTASMSPANADEAANAIAEDILYCDSRPTVIADLKKGYAEEPTALGVTTAGTVMELWTSTNGKTWTLIVTLTNGRSCVVGAGDDWTSIQKTARGKIL